MASKKNNQKKQAHRTTKRINQWPSNMMTLRLSSGLLFMAIGVLFFLAVIMRLRGDLFSSIRYFCQGLSGALVVALPVFPVWGGILLFESVRRKTSSRVYWLSLLCYALLLSISTCFTFTGSPSIPLLDWLASTGSSTGSYKNMLMSAYHFSSGKGVAGGAIGLSFAWPLWSLIGAIPCGIISILVLMIILGFIFRIDLVGIKNNIQDIIANQKRMKEESRREYEKRQMLWQQEQARNQPASQAAIQSVRKSPSSSRSPKPAGEPVYHPAFTSDQSKMHYGFQPVQEENSYTPSTVSMPREMHSAAGRIVSRIFGVGGDKGRSSSTESIRKSSQTTETHGWSVPSYTASNEAETIEQSSDLINDNSTNDALVDLDESSDLPVWSVSDQTQAQSSIGINEKDLTAKSNIQVSFLPSDEQRDMKIKHAPKTSLSPENQSEWQRQVEDKNTASDQATVTQHHQVSAHPQRRRSQKKAADLSANLQKPMESWADETIPPWEQTEVSQPATTILPPEQKDNKSKWQPELQIKPSGDESKTFGSTVAVKEVPDLLPYIYPDVALLNQPQAQAGISPQEDAERAHKLEETLASFKIQSKVRHITHGPAVSRFEIELAPGINVNKVTNLGQNIAMNMEAKSVRIEAPIPGKSLVGIEIPNRKVSTVTLRELLESSEMRTATKPLVVALGRDIAGTPITCDLSKMPHLLIAGATGSGKSVCINTIINSLLYRCSPKDVRMILVDPKVVELQCYNGVPHLLLPVVSDPHKASGALAWAVDEMMDRYNRFQTHSVRSIDSYNENLQPGEEKMPRIVIIIDELADLMMVCKRDVEERICRIAQLARAAGIHLIVATQRPSVDVITGLIKANIPSRIAFKVSSFVDSRTILDSNGADQLLGNGDMLYKPVGQFTPTRIQGCFLSDQEVNNVTDFIRATCPAEYDPSIIEQLEHLQDDEGSTTSMPSTNDFAGETSTNSDASLLMQCIEMAVEDRQVSTSMLQRRLRVGYSRAGRLVDEMEKRGIVSAQDGSKPRLCLITREEFEQMKASGALK